MPGMSYDLLFSVQNLLAIQGYMRLRQYETIAGIGLDPTPYSTHSLGSGGATLMAHSHAANPNLNCLLKLRGRWKSDSSKDMYVQDTLESRLT